jgi:hypothetical protein
MKTGTYFRSYLAQFFLECEMFQTKVIESIKTHILCSFCLNRALYEIMWKNTVSRASHRRQYGACALHAGYLRLQTHTHRIRNTYCCSIATTVARTRLNITLYVHCLPCFNSEFKKRLRFHRYSDSHKHLCVKAKDPS